MSASTRGGLRDGLRDGLLDAPRRQDVYIKKGCNVLTADTVHEAIQNELPWPEDDPENNLIEQFQPFLLPMGKF